VPRNQAEWERSSSYMKKSKRHEILCFLAALWLLGVVLVSIGLEISRTQTPIKEWPAKIVHLLGM
jgi:hypothetical protein